MRPARARVRLRVVPGARSAGIVGRHGTAWKVRVAAAAERGAANEAVIRLLSDVLSVPRQGITLVSGHTTRDKIVEISGVSPADADSRLGSAERKDSRR